MEREISDVKELFNYAGHCDSPQCPLFARWMIRFNTNLRLFLCKMHKEETVRNYSA